MDKDLKKLILETVNEFFENSPIKMVERGERTEYYDICPHCKKEIYEKHEYTEDAGMTWRHSDCKGRIDRPEEPLDNVAEWLRPYVEEFRAKRRKFKKSVDEKLPPSGEKKYNKQEPGGTMSAVNI